MESFLKKSLLFEVMLNIMYKQTFMFPKDELKQLCDPSTFSIVLSTAKTFNCLNISVHDQISSKVKCLLTNVGVINIIPANHQNDTIV